MPDITPAQPQSETDRGNLAVALLAATIVVVVLGVVGLVFGAGLFTGFLIWG